MWRIKSKEAYRVFIDVLVTHMRYIHRIDSAHFVITYDYYFGATVT